MKKVLVTGGAGFIGSNLISNLIHKKYDITSIDNYSIGSKINHYSEVKYIDDDINNINKLNLKNFDYCFHLAAQSRVQPSFNNPEESFRSNVSGTFKIIEWTKDNCKKLIYAGSSSRHHDHYASPYATTKYLGEEICKLYKKSFNLKIEIARFYNVYGPNEPVDEKFGNVIGIWRSKLKSGNSLPIVGDGNQKRDFTHVADIVSGIIAIADSDKMHDDAWELGSGVNYSVNDLLSMFKEKFDVNSHFVEDQPGNFRESIRVNDDSLELLNWYPKDRLKDYINSLK